MCQEKIGVIYSRDLRKFKAILWISKCNFLVVRRTGFVPCGCCAENFLEYRHDLYGKGYKTNVEFSASFLELKLTA